MSDKTQGKLLILKHTFNNNREKLLSVLIRGKRLLHVQAESGSEIGNIYIAKVTKVTRSAGACYVSIRRKEFCYLLLAEAEDPTCSLLLNREWDGTVRAGDELLVQVKREALKTKLPSVTTRISFSGKYTVLSTGQKHLGFSGKLKEERKKDVLSFLQEAGYVDDKKLCNIKESMGLSYGFVIRTNAASLEDNTCLLQEWRLLEEKWHNLLSYVKTRTCYSCLYEEQPTYIKNLRDIYDESYEEIVTDIPEVYENIKAYLEENPLLGQPSVRLYQDELISLGNLYGVSSKISAALGSHVWLKSGAYLVIEPTEALTVIDVNSGKYESKKGTPDLTAYQVNMEAAREIAFQLKLRNLSGIIIVDFINMKERDNQILLKHLKQLCHKDSVPTEVIDITPLGLVEITRKKINKTLKEQLLS